MLFRPQAKIRWLQLPNGYSVTHVDISPHGITGRLRRESMKDTTARVGTSIQEAVIALPFVSANGDSSKEASYIVCFEEWSFST